MTEPKFTLKELINNAKKGAAGSLPALALHIYGNARQIQEVFNISDSVWARICQEHMILCHGPDSLLDEGSSHELIVNMAELLITAEHPEFETLRAQFEGTYIRKLSEALIIEQAAQMPLEREYRNLGYVIIRPSDNLSVATLRKTCGELGLKSACSAMMILSNPQYVKSFFPDPAPDPTKKQPKPTPIPTESASTFKFISEEPAQEQLCILVLEGKNAHKILAENRDKLLDALQHTSPGVTLFIPANRVELVAGAKIFAELNTRKNLIDLKTDGARAIDCVVKFNEGINIAQAALEVQPSVVNPELLTALVYASGYNKDGVQKALVKSGFSMTQSQFDSIVKRGEIYCCFPGGNDIDFNRSRLLIKALAKLLFHNEHKDPDLLEASFTKYFEELLTAPRLARKRTAEPRPQTAGKGRENIFALGIG